MPSAIPRPLRALRFRLARGPLAGGGRRLAFYALSHSLYGLIAGGFETALILRITGSVERVVVFNLCMYLLLYLAFLGGTLLLRSGKLSRSFRLDLAVQALACLYLAVNFANLGSSLVLGGFFMLKGISEGLYWSTRHSALLHLVSAERRDGWALKLQIASILLGVAVPLAAGFVISYVVLPTPVAGSPLPPGYFPVWLLAAAVAGIALLLSPRLRIGRQDFSLKRSLGLRRARHSGALMGCMFFGTAAGVSVAISVAIINFAVLRTEFNIGLFAAWITLASAAFFFGVGRVLRARRSLPRLPLVFAGSLGELASRGIFAFFPSLPGLVAKSLVDSFVVPLRGVFGDNILRRRIELLAREQGASVAETVMFQETVLIVGRVITCGVLIVVLNVVAADPVAVARTLLMVFLGYSLVDFLFIRHIHRGNQRIAPLA